MFFVHCLQMRNRLIGILAVNSKMRLTVSVELACTICACNSPLESVRAAVWGHAHPSSVDNTHAGGTEQRAQHGINKLDPFRGKIAPSRSSNISSSGGTARNVLACAHTHAHSPHSHSHSHPTQSPTQSPTQRVAGSSDGGDCVDNASKFSRISVSPTVLHCDNTYGAHTQAYASFCEILHSVTYEHMCVLSPLSLHPSNAVDSMTHKASARLQAHVANAIPGRTCGFNRFNRFLSAFVKDIETWINLWHKYFKIIKM